MDRNRHQVQERAVLDPGHQIGRDQQANGGEQESEQQPHGESPCSIMPLKSPFSPGAALDEAL